MAKKFLTGLNLVVLDVDPTTGSEGELYFNSSASVAKIYQAGSWSVLGAGGGGTTVGSTEPESPEIGDSWYKNDTGEFYVYDGTYWVEVNGVIEANGALTGITSIENPDYITFNTTPGTSNEDPGTLSWDEDFETLKLQVNDITLQIGQEHIIRVKNGSASTAIPNMRLVMFSGATGDTVEVTPALSTASYEPELMVGITTEEIPADGFGFVTQFGFVNKVNTSTPGWSLGDLLYCDPINPGLLTNVKPSAPNWNFPIAAVTRVHANTGRILVRAIPGKHLHDIVDTSINDISDNQVLIYNSSASVWQNGFQKNLIIEAYNDSGSTIDAFVPVAFSDNDATNGILIVPANASDSFLMPAIGFTTESILDGTSGKVIMYGLLSGVDTSTFSIDDPIYVGSGGGLTSVRPTGSDIVQEIGKVVKIGSTDGEVLVYNTGRSTNLPNLSEGSIWLGNVTSFPTQTTLDTSVVPENGPIYFTNERAVDALSTTLEDYLTESDAGSTYLTQVNASTTYQPVGDYVTLDDPQTISGVKKINSWLDFIAPGYWDEADFGTGRIEYNAMSDRFEIKAYPTVGKPGGDTGGRLWLTATSDIVLSSGTDEVYLGNHLSSDNQIATIGNLSASISSHNHTLDSLSNVVITGATDGQALVWDTTTSKWVNETVTQDLSSYATLTGTETLSNKTILGELVFTNITSGVNGFVYTDDFGKLVVSTSNALYLEGDDYVVLATGSPGGQYLGSVTANNQIATIGDLTLEKVTDGGATTTNAITISNTTQSTTPTTGALIISGGIGIAKDVWIDGDLHVNGTTVTENTKTVATHDNMIYLNAALDSTVTNAVGDGTYVTYTAENNYTPGMDIRVTGMDPSGYNIATADLLTVYSATSTQFVVAKTTTGTFVSGGTAHAKEEVNPDLGFAGGYYDAGYAHAGLFRDASDGVFKFFQGYTPEPDEAVNIDTTHASFALANIAVGDLSVNGGDITSSASTVNLFNGLQTINIGNLSDVVPGQQAINIASNRSAPIVNIGNSSTATAGQINIGGGYITSPVDVVISGDVYFPRGFRSTSAEIDDLYLINPLSYEYGGTGITSLGTAGQVLTVNSTEDAVEWTTPSGGGGGPSTTTTSITANTAVVIESFATATSRTAEAIVQITQGSNYYSSKVLVIHNGTTVKITEYAILESTVGAIPVTISSVINGSDVEIRATITNAATTNATAKVVMTEVEV